MPGPRPRQNATGQACLQPGGNDLRRQLGPGIIDYSGEKIGQGRVPFGILAPAVP